MNPARINHTTLHVILSNPVRVDPKPLAQYLSELKQNVQNIYQKVENQLNV